MRDRGVDFLEREMGNIKGSMKEVSREEIKAMRVERKGDVRMKAFFNDILRFERRGGKVTSIGDRYELKVRGSWEVIWLGELSILG